MKRKSRLKTVIVITSMLLISFGIIHIMTFPQETRCSLIDFNNFEREDDVY